MPSSSGSLYSLLYCTFCNHSGSCRHVEYAWRGRHSPCRYSTARGSILYNSLSSMPAASATRAVACYSFACRARRVVNATRACSRRPTFLWRLLRQRADGETMPDMHSIPWHHRKTPRGRRDARALPCNSGRQTRRRLLYGDARFGALPYIPIAEEQFLRATFSTLCELFCARRYYILRRSRVPPAVLPFCLRGVPRRAMARVLRTGMRGVKTLAGHGAFCHTFAA